MKREFAFLHEAIDERLEKREKESSVNQEDSDVTGLEIAACQ